jgi:hypothetical protein
MAALVSLVCTACTGLPGYEADMDADLYNKSTGAVVTYVIFHGDGEHHQEDRTLPGDATPLALGGSCMTG